MDISGWIAKTQSASIFPRVFFPTPGGIRQLPTSTRDLQRPGGEEAYDPNKIQDLEFSVVDLPCQLAGLIDIETDSPIMEQPDYFMTRADWIKALCFTLFTSPVVSIVRVKSKFRALPELKIYPDSVKPIMLQKGQKFRYPENFGTGGSVQYEVDVRDVWQFTATPFTDRLRKARRAEYVYWKHYYRIIEKEGVVEVGDKNLISAAPRDVEDEMLRELVQTSREQSALALPSGYVWRQAQSQRPDIKETLFNILRAYCAIYHVPVGLFAIDLPSRSATPAMAVYGRLVRERLSPVLNAVMKGLEMRLDASIELDYDPILKPAASEEADTYMKYSQTGAFTINEIREMAGKPPREDGDRYPDVAGAPPSGQEPGGENGGQD